MSDWISVALPKVYDLLVMNNESGAWKLTRVEGRDELQCVDQLAVESTCHLYPHTGWEEEEIEISKVSFLVPWHLVLCHHLGENGI